MDTGVPVTSLRKYRKYKLRGELDPNGSATNQCRNLNSVLTLNHVDSLYLNRHYNKNIPIVLTLISVELTF